MNAIVWYYPKNNIYIQNDDKYKEIFTTFTHDKKLYLINVIIVIIKEHIQEYN